MSILLKENGKKYVMDWDGTSDSIKVMRFDIASWNTGSQQYDYTYVETYTFSSAASGIPIWGSWYDTTTQTTTVNTPTPMYCNSGGGNGITKISNTDFEVSEAGVYNIQFSAQLDQDSGAGHHIYIWLRKNGVDVPDSASEIAIQGTVAETVAAWNWFIDLNADDYINIMYYVDNAAVHIKAVPADALKPAIPSVILTMNRISKI